VGERIKLAYTRAMVDAIHSGALREAAMVTDKVFGLSVIAQCPGVPDEVLQPRQTWSDPAAYDAAAQKLAASFQQNYDAFQSGGPVGAMDG
jgi:phosphoenolpyruvate carboxykinase (ATP)